MLRTILLAVMALAATPAAAAPWSSAVHAAIRGKQVMPRSAELRKATCTARLKISVDGNGLITGYSIVKPCALPILTRSTDDLMFAVGQLPPPPARRPVSFEVNVNWPPKGRAVNAH